MRLLSNFPLQECEDYLLALKIIFPCGFQLRIFKFNILKLFIQNSLDSLNTGPKNCRDILLNEFGTSKKTKNIEK